MSDVALLEPGALDAPMPCPPVARAAAPQLANPVVMPDGRALATAVGGFLVAGLAAGLGASATEVAVRAVPAGLAVGLGALVLTGPALVVGHQYLGLAARPVDLAASLADGFVRAGRCALGFSPVVLFFSLSTSLWMVAAAVVALASGAVGLGWGGAALRGAESPSMRMDALVIAWSTLASLVALRLAVHVAFVVLG